MREQHIRLAIFPIQNLSDRSDIHLFCKGLVIDLITDLSRFRSFQIIPLHGLEVQEMVGLDMADSELSDKLELDYVVEGAVRSQNDTLLFNVQLINIPQHRLVWAERFTGTLAQLFEIQEKMAEKIVVSLRHFMNSDLIGTLHKKQLTHLNAYECWLKGMEELKNGTIEADEQARVFFQQAIAIDPQYARAHTGMSLTYFNEWSCQLWSRWEVCQKGAYEWAQKAVELDQQDPISMAILGKIYLFDGEYLKAEHYLRQSFNLNPNDADNLIHIATGLVYLGYKQEGYHIYQKAKRINPLDGVYQDIGLFIHFELERFDKAIELGEKLFLDKGWVDLSAYLAAAYFHQGDMTRMQLYWTKFIEIFAKRINQGKIPDNQTALQWMIDINPYKNTSTSPMNAFWQYIGKSTNQSPTYSKVKSQPQFLPANHFYIDGNQWSISYAAQQIFMTDLKGLHDIVQLIAHPNQNIHCTELMGMPVQEKGEAVFDAKAREAYQQKLIEIQQDLEEAESLSNSQHIQMLQREYDDLVDHLAKAIGMGGKTRKLSDATEKARTAVTWRIRNAIKKISAIHPTLGKHLGLSIKTGIFCEYSPENHIEWVLKK